MQEQRKETRKGTSDYYLVYERETNEFLGRVLDLNTDGIMMISDGEIEVPKTFACKMVMPRSVGRFKNFSFDAVSKWCQKNKRLNVYETGFQLLNLSDDDKALIGRITEDWNEKGKISSIPADF